MHSQLGVASALREGDRGEQLLDATGRIPPTIQGIFGTEYDVDWTGTIRRWVEVREAPSRIVARTLRGTLVVRTRPLCAYPLTARCNGPGDTDDAAAFSCR